MTKEQPVLQIELPLPTLPPVTISEPSRVILDCLEDILEKANILDD